MRSLDNARLAIIGLGYVGLPLAVEFGKHFDTSGFDIDATRVDELRAGHDHDHAFGKRESVLYDVRYILPLKAVDGRV